MSRTSRLLTAGIAALALVGIGSPSLATDGDRQGTTPPPAARSSAAAASPTAEALALAMDIPPDSLISADYGESDPRAFAISDGVPIDEAVPEDPGPGVPTTTGPVPTAAAASTGGLGFPSRGSDFLVMSSGDASHAMRPNAESDLTTTLDGSSNEQGDDLAQLHLRLRPPSGARCFAFDVAYYSEEYPEYVGSAFDDAFTAQLGTGETRIVDGHVEAASNFAQDEQGNALSINTVFGMTSGTGTTYDGGTSRLRAGAPVLLGEIDVYLTIQDVGDEALDSAAFIDSFFWSTDRNCRFGSSEDSDGDGLLDEWETDGLVVLTGAGQEVVDLPAMGADPGVPDVFVEIDHMADGAHSHAPEPGAITDVVDAFARNGVHLHVDYGPQAPLTYGAAATWGDLSGGEGIDEDEHLGDNGLFGWFSYRWGEFDDLKGDHFEEVRAPVFHYNVWAHHLSEKMGTTSGLSRGSLEGASDFVVSLGGWTGDVGSRNEQAGTFMHELGHNLGLGHGGDDHENHKPNYLSVMNYLFQSGLPAGNDTFDYSPYALVDLDESSVVEADGIGMPSSVSTRHIACGATRTTNGDAIDFNCDGDTVDTLARDVNGDGERSVLRGAQDWGQLLYTGGAIGMPGGLVELPEETSLEHPEITYEESLELQDPPAVPAVEVAPTLPSGPVRVGAEVVASVPFTATGGTATDVAAVWSWGDGTSSDGTATGDTDLVATGTHTYTRAGLYDVSVTLTADGGVATSPVATVVVVDPAAGPVAVLAALTPAQGAAPATPAAKGPASLVLAASWVGGRTTPVGASVLTWPGARLRVVGHDASWLVVGGAIGMLESSAVVNDRPGYRQRVTVTDGPVPTVRVQVWDPRVGPLGDPSAQVLDSGTVRAAGLVAVGG